MYSVQWQENGVTYYLKSLNPFQKTTNADERKTFAEEELSDAQNAKDWVTTNHPEFDGVHIFPQPKPH